MDKRLQDIKTRLEATTEGTWVVKTDKFDTLNTRGKHYVGVKHHKKLGQAAILLATQDQGTWADASFAANAKEDIAYLLTLLEAASPKAPERTTPDVTLILTGVETVVPTTYAAVYALCDELLGITTWDEVQVNNLLSYAQLLNPRFAYILSDALIKSPTVGAKLVRASGWQWFAEHQLPYVEGNIFKRVMHKVSGRLDDLNIYICNVEAFDEDEAVIKTLRNHPELANMHLYAKVTS